MHPNPRKVAPIILVIILLAAAAWWYFGSRRAAADTGAVSASGTIEATQINISPELGGRVRAVNVKEGESVKAGDVLVQFDAALLNAQRAQAAAGLKAAQANLALLKAGPSDEQLAVAQSAVDRAGAAADAAQSAYDALPEAAQATITGQTLKQQLDIASATLDNAQAQYDLLLAGARPQQLDAAQAQVDAAQAAVDALGIQIGKLTLTAPVDGVVLSRVIEPGEVASPSATLLVIGQLNDLTITVYVPEDRYGSIRLEQTAQVSVDSFPGESFPATVAHIADQAEFTPRNVQTASGRKTTVFAIRLNVSNSDGKLKPGMPADVKFGN